MSSTTAANSRIPLMTITPSAPFPYNGEGPADIFRRPGCRRHPPHAILPRSRAEPWRARCGPFHCYPQVRAKRARTRRSRLRPPATGGPDGTSLSASTSASMPVREGSREGRGRHRPGRYRSADGGGEQLR